MKKLTLLALVVFSTSSFLKAQNEAKLKFSIGPELSVATGTFSNSHSVGIGGTAQVEVSLKDKLYGTATGGVISYNGKSFGSGLKYKGQTIVPIRVGAKYFLSGGVYGAVQAGIGILNNDGGVAFAYSPQIGYEFTTNSGKAIDAAFKYDGYSKNGTLSSVGLRVAYKF